MDMKLKKFFWILAFTSLSIPFCIGCTRSPSTEDTGHTVAFVDLERYMGTWYALATLPAWFQKDCSCITAEYIMREDYVAVTNACRKGAPDGPLETSTAKAFVVPGTGNSRLKVQFFWPFKGDYWIIALGDDYQYAMVGHPQRTYLWILSRKPHMDAKTYHSLIETARDKGYDVERLERISHECDGT